MKRVVILANHDAWVYNLRKELIEGLLEQNYEVYVSSPRGDRFDDLERIGCRLIDTRLNRHGLNPLEDLRLSFFYFKLIRQLRPSAVLSFTIKPNIYGGIAAGLAQVPYLVNIAGLGVALGTKSGLSNFLVLMYRLALRKASVVFFQNSEDQRFFIERAIALKKHRMLPGSGVNLERFRPLEYPDDTETHFVFIARIMREKGIEQYLAAARALTERHSNVRFHICGFCEDQYEEDIREMNREGIVLYHGMVRDIRDVYAKIHCTVHPSFYPEGISNVLLESCACARPIITTDHAGCREVVEDGVNGYQVAQRDSRTLIEAMEKFLKLSYREKRRMGLNGRKKVETEFDRRIVVERYMEELARVASQRKAEVAL